MSAPQSLDAVVHEASQLQRLDRLDEALAVWRRTVALRPQSFELWSALGSCAMRARATAEGLAAFRRAVELEPRLPGTWYNLGNALQAMGEDAEAGDAYEKSLALDAGMLPARINLGDLRLRQGRAAEALDQFERVRTVDPGAPRVDYNIGVALLELARNADAIAAFRAALGRDGRDLDAWNNLCVALMREGRAEEALGACDRLLTLAPANRKALAYRAAALLELGRRDEAAVLLDFDRLVQAHRPAAPAEFGSVEALNAALAEHVLAHPTLAWEPAGKATRGGSQTGELLTDPRPAPIAALELAIRAAVAGYIEHVRAALPAHPYTRGLPARWRLASWAVVLKAQGQQGPHFHPDGYVSGVYYLRLPEVVKQGAGDQGCIEFGRTEAHLGGRAEAMTRTFRPEEGLMFLFPSYLYHRTLPFESAVPRLCIAFDVLPEA